MTEPLVSILMPVRNAEATLAEAAASVKAQSISDWELLLIDDASTDGSRDLMRRLGEGDERIRLMRNAERLGPGGARMLALREARGDWIALLDADDRWSPDKLQKQLALARLHPEAGFYYTGSGFLRADGTEIACTLSVPTRLDRKALLRQNLIPCPSVLLRRELLERHPMPSDPRLHEDYAAWLSILGEVPYAYGLDEPLLLYRLSSASRNADKLRAARMHWRTLRSAGLPLAEQLPAMGSYALGSLAKYARLAAAQRK